MSNKNPQIFDLMYKIFKQFSAILSDSDSENYDGHFDDN
jgi:hypothetical protein